jgi:hypothetical protein
MLITVPLSPRRVSRLANPLADADCFLSMPISILLRMRKAGTFTPLGAIATRIAARLTARRDAEILLSRGEKPAEHGQRHQARQPTTNAAQDRSVGRLNEKSRHVLSGKGGVRGGIGRVCAHPGETVIQVATSVWGTRRDRPGRRRLRSPLKAFVRPTIRRPTQRISTSPSWACRPM